LGVQYYQGEPVQLWALYGDENMAGNPNVYLYRADKSRELLVKGHRRNGLESWYLAQDGSIYCIATDYEKGVSTVVKRDETGAELYSQEQDMRIDSLCQLADGRLFAVLNDNGGINAMSRIGELDPDTGFVTELSQIQAIQGICYLGAGAEKLLLLNAWMGELQEVDPADGSAVSLMTFTGTSYNRSDLTVGDFGEIEDFRVLEDGGLELLRSIRNMGARETLRLQEVTKIPIVVRGYHFNNGWIKERVAAFNKENEDYYVVLEEVAEGGDWDDFATQTSIQIATGKGPDILYGTVISDYVQGMIDKGGFEDLKPYMDESGIKEEDYFPSAFMWREGEKIYGINIELFTYRYSIDASVLGEEQEMNIENLVNALYSYPDKAMYMRFCDSGDILEMFLQGSEDFWGMIDWEEGSCNFGGELFARMLDVAKRYAYDENQDYPILAEHISCDMLFQFDAPLIQEREGRRTAGVMFDDGCYPAMNYTYQIFTVNANSSRKEGAWEFIRFLLGDESQTAIMGRYEGAMSTPIQKKAFEAFLEKETKYLEKHKTTEIGSAYMYKGKYVEERKTISREDVTEEWLDAFRQAAEEARPLPLRTVPLLEIIREEAAYYFGGTKSIGEVVAVIENRVQLYIDENGL
ncbi:MAG: extracellular solute-binding protein, partial [Lachnospiraceae bacterium]|nr:extracellular solute-binding protein [Lachnospiraceae bacterium]